MVTTFKELFYPDPYNQESEADKLGFKLYQKSLQGKSVHISLETPIVQKYYNYYQNKDEAKRLADLESARQESIRMTEQQQQKIQATLQPALSESFTAQDRQKLSEAQKKYYQEQNSREFYDLLGKGEILGYSINPLTPKQRAKAELLAKVKDSYSQPISRDYSQIGNVEYFEGKTPRAKEVISSLTPEKVFIKDYVPEPYYQSEGYKGTTRKEIIDLEPKKLFQSGKELIYELNPFTYRKEIGLKDKPLLNKAVNKWIKTSNEFNPKVLSLIKKSQDIYPLSKYDYPFKESTNKYIFEPIAKAEEYVDNLQRTTEQRVKTLKNQDKIIESQLLGIGLGTGSVVVGGYKGLKGFITFGPDLLINPIETTYPLLNPRETFEYYGTELSSYPIKTSAETIGTILSLEFMTKVPSKFSDIKRKYNIEIKPSETRVSRRLNPIISLKKLFTNEKDIITSMGGDIPGFKPNKITPGGGGGGGSRRFNEDTLNLIKDIDTDTNIGRTNWNKRSDFSFNTPTNPISRISIPPGVYNTIDNLINRGISSGYDFGKRVTRKVKYNTNYLIRDDAGLIAFKSEWNKGTKTSLPSFSDIEGFSTSKAFLKQTSTKSKNVLNSRGYTKTLGIFDYDITIRKLQYKPYVTPKDIPFYRKGRKTFYERDLLGKFKIKKEEIIAPEYFKGQRYPQIKKGQSAGELLAEFEPKLPGEKKPGAYHTSGEPLPKSGRVQKSASELDILYSSPLGNPSFLRLGSGEKQFFTSNIFETISPTASRLTPEGGFKLIPGIKKSDRKLLSLSKARRFINTKAEEGISYIPFIKTEKEAGAIINTRFATTKNRYYTIFEGRTISMPEITLYKSEDLLKSRPKSRVNEKVIDIDKTLKDLSSSYKYKQRGEITPLQLSYLNKNIKTNISPIEIDKEILKESSSSRYKRGSRISLLSSDYVSSRRSNGSSRKSSISSGTYSDVSSILSYEYPSKISSKSSKVSRRTSYRPSRTSYSGSYIGPSTSRLPDIPTRPGYYRLYKGQKMSRINRKNVKPKPNENLYIVEGFTEKILKLTRKIPKSRVLKEAMTEGNLLKIRGRPIIK